jgi:hypothetical protein
MGFLRRGQPKEEKTPRMPGELELTFNESTDVIGNLPEKLKKKLYEEMQFLPLSLRVTGYQGHKMTVEVALENAKKDPTYVSGMYKIVAILRLFEGNLDEAKKYLEMATEVEPRWSYTTVLENLSIVKTLVDRYERKVKPPEKDLQAAEKFLQGE